MALEARPESWGRWRGSPEMFHSTVTGSYPPAKSIVTVGSFDDDSQGGDGCLAEIKWVEEQGDAGGVAGSRGGRWEK